MIKNQKRFDAWPPAGHDGVFVWDFLDDAWQMPTLSCPEGTIIKPMDFDAVVERKGQVLIMETKMPGAKVSTGQKITLTDQWKKGATIFFIEGKSPESICGLAVYGPNSWREGRNFGDVKVMQCDFTDVIYRARCWFCWACGDTPPTREEWDHETIRTRRLDTDGQAQ